MSTPEAQVKCVIWDLDDTLWRGTLLEGDGVVPVDHRVAMLRGLDRRGVLQSVVSRGDRALAERRLGAEQLLDLLVAPQIGWCDKSESVGTIMRALGFAPESFVFVDNDPFERDEVAAVHPDVRCLTPEDADTVLSALAAGRPATAEAGARRGMYQAELRRQEAQERAADKGAFERSLDLRLTVAAATEADLARCAELTLRTTQLNTTGRVIPQDRLAEMVDDPGYAVLVVRVTDRYGDYGTVGLAVLRFADDTWDLELLATSCRVVSRGVGGMLLSLLASAATESGRVLRVAFLPTERNKPMLLALRFAGLVPEPAAGADARFFVTRGEPAAIPEHVTVVRSWVAP